MMLPLSVLALVVAAAAAPILVRVSRRFGGLALAAVPFALGCWFATRLGAVGRGDVLLDERPWVEALGVSLSFRLDGLALLFALLISFVGALVVLYASSYMVKHERMGSFMATLLAFMASMLGLVLADNLIVLFVFWELTSITSFLLIGFDFHRESARRSALQALLVTGMGGLALLAGVIMLGIAAGGFDLATVLAADVHDDPMIIPIVVLVLVGAFSKSAIVPFHFWLPNAMEAPSPVSALLHSSTMVKAGVYLVARLHPTLGGAWWWTDALVAFGAATMVVGAFLAIRQDEFKRILAYSTVSSLGVLVLLIGLDAPVAAATYLLAHAMFKGALFLIAGSVIKKTGEKQPERLGGLLRLMPITAVAAGVAALSFAGMAPFLGFAGKELLLKAGLAHEAAWVVVSLTVVAAVWTVVAALLVGWQPFAGPRAQEIGAPHDPDWRQLAGPIALACGGLLAGVLPGLFAEPLVAATAASITQAPVETVSLSLAKLFWPPSLALGLSFLAIALGIAWYASRAPLGRLVAPVDRLGAVGPARGYAGIFSGVMSFAAFQTRLLQSGSLRAYVRITLIAFTIVGAIALLRAPFGVSPLPDTSDLTLLDVVLGIGIVVAAAAAVLQRTPLVSVAVLGAVGFLVALVFLLMGAPDPAMTQFAVETLIVVIFALVILHLPRFSHLSGVPSRLRDATIAAGFGLLMAGFTWVVAARPTPEPISLYHAARAATDAYGRNVVNVILVDFRALDTLGEIFVVAVAAIGVFTLMRLRARGDAAESDGDPDHEEGSIT